jgi:hypothetical protein
MTFVYTGLLSAGNYSLFETGEIMSQEYNEKFRADPVAFMKKFTVIPGDAGSIGTLVGTMDRKNKLSNNDFSYSHMNENSRVAYLEFKKLPSGASSSNAHPGGAIDVSGQLYPTVDAIKSYYLPWGMNKVISLTIPALGTTVRHNDVEYFFTAAISGCSIFIKGTPQAPTIFHAGGTTGKADPREAAQFWRDMMSKHAQTRGPVDAEINKTNYVLDQVGAGTAHSRQFEAWLAGNTPGNLTVEDVAPTGCVMGLRDAQGDWSFYLQENVTITHTKFSKAHFYSLKKTVKSQNFVSARPMIFRKFFPGGLAHANFQPAMPRALKT